MSTSGIPFDGDSPFRIGMMGTSNQIWNGAVNGLGFWKRVITQEEINKLYNNGYGLAYPFDRSQLTHRHNRITGHFKNMGNPLPF